jgi:UDP-N-acetylmuramate dehydrogenase
MAENLQEKFTTLTSGPVFVNEPLARFTTLRVGGPADFLVHPINRQEVEAVIQVAHEEKMPIFVFGGGSNLLIRDGGIRGIVINLMRGFQGKSVISESQDNLVLQVEAGVTIPALLQFLCENGLSGLEFMAGIPASLGGALWMNAGTREGEIGDRVESLTFIDKNGRIKTFTHTQCGFSYRHTDLPTHAIILEATIKLARGNTEKIKQKIEKLRSRRVETQPLNLPNIGSVFKNPKKGYAGQIIEDAGLKNVRVGHARISEKHGNFIVNEGKASAKDVLALIGLIKDKVKERCQVRLETEVHVVGEDA